MKVLLYIENLRFQTTQILLIILLYVEDKQKEKFFQYMRTFDSRFLNSNYITQWQ